VWESIQTFMSVKLHVVEGGVTKSYTGKVVALEELLPFLVVGVGGILWKVFRCRRLPSR
jgi:hypothetical protein